MRIIVDVMSGDKAPLEMLLGVAQASEQSFSKGVDFTLVGDESIIKSLAAPSDILFFSAKSRARSSHTVSKNHESTVLSSALQSITDKPALRASLYCSSFITPHSCIAYNTLFLFFKHFSGLSRGLYLDGAFVIPTRVAASA